MPQINQFTRFDVRPLLALGEEPFPAICARARALKAGDGLIVIAPFLPSPLIGGLEPKDSSARSSEAEARSGSFTSGGRKHDICMTTSFAQFKEAAVANSLRSCQLFIGIAMEHLHNIAAVTMVKTLEKGGIPFS